MHGGTVTDADNPSGQAFLTYQGLQNAQGITGLGYQREGGMNSSYPQCLGHEDTYPGYRRSGVAFNPQAPGYGVHSG